MMADILPFAETEPAILTDRDGFLASIATFEVKHSGRLSCIGLRVLRLNRTIQEPTTDQSPIDVVASIGFNGVLLLSVLTHVKEGASGHVSFLRTETRLLVDIFNGTALMGGFVRLVIS